MGEGENAEITMNMFPYSFCETRCKRSVEVCRGKNLHPPPAPHPQTVTDTSQRPSKSVTDIINYS